MRFGGLNGVRLLLAILILFTLLIALPTTSLADNLEGAKYRVSTQSEVEALPSDINAAGYNIALSVEGSGLQIKGLHIHGASIGILIDSQSDVTVSDCEISDNLAYGIWLYDHSTGNLVVNNKIHGNVRGILLHVSCNNIIKDNYVYDNQLGIYLDYSSDGNKVVNNIVSDGGYGIHVIGNSGHNSLLHNTVSNNEYGISLYESCNNVIEDNDVSENRMGIYLDQSSNYNKVVNNDASNMKNGFGISVIGNSGHNSLLHNTVSNNLYGIFFHTSSCNNLIAYNTASNNKNFGISFEGSSCNNVIEKNILYDNVEGIYMDDLSSSNTMANNLISENLDWGIVASSDNLVTDNIIFWNRGGIYIRDSGNILYHNNFIFNSIQTENYLGVVNIWDNGYPSGGNHWSDYAGIDKFNGPNQDVVGSDGIGDTAYTIDVNNRDEYPLMEPSSVPAIILAIKETVAFWNLPKRIASSLTAILDGAIQSLNKGNVKAAVSKLRAFIYAVEAQRDKALTDEQADLLISEAQRIIDLIG